MNNTHTMGPMPTIKDNLTRILRHHGLASHVHLTKYEEDRAWGWAGPELFDLVVTQGWDPDIGRVVESLHGAKVAFREPGGVRPALQVVFHPYTPKHGVKMIVGNLAMNLVPWEAAYFLELDFDYASPSGGIRSFLIHAYEVLSNWITGSKTNQDTISAMLDKRGIEK